MLPGEQNRKNHISHRVWFVAEMIPIGIPSIIARISAPTARISVLGKELKMSSNIILFDT